MKSFKKLLFATLFGVVAVVAFSACHRDEKDEPVTPEVNTPLCFTAQEDSSTVSMRRKGTIEFPSLEYSFDGKNWQHFLYSKRIDGFEPVVLAKAGDKIYVRNQGKTNKFSSSSSYLYFKLSGRIAASGNIMSLLDKDNFSTMTEIQGEGAFCGLFFINSALVTPPLLPATVLSKNCYNSMFSGCTNLIEAPELPATEMAHSCYIGMFLSCENLKTAPELQHITKASTQCFDNMFSGCSSLTKAPDLPNVPMYYLSCRSMFAYCTSLTSAPALPSTTMGTSCYAYMFIGCTGLTSAPALPATTLDEGSYLYMFRDCTSLTSAPALPATVLADKCYAGMFDSCVNLTAAPELPATTLADYCYYGMFEGCNSLTTAPELPATEMKYGCYWGMFVNCSSMTKAPRLPATTLAGKCYDWMFNGCTNLDYIEVAFDQWSESTDSVTFEWVDNVAAEGTFVCPDNLTDIRSINNIPEGWTKTNTPANISSTQRKATAKPRTGNRNIHKPEFLKAIALKEFPSEAQCVLTDE